MKTIQLTHGEERLQMNENEAVGLHQALEKALHSAGIDPRHHATVKAPAGIQSFNRDAADGTPTLTDC